MENYLVKNIDDSYSLMFIGVPGLEEDTNYGKVAKKIKKILNEY